MKEVIKMNRLREEIFLQIHNFRFEDVMTVSQITDMIMSMFQTKIDKTQTKIDEIILNHDKPVDMTLYKKIKELLK